MDQAKFLKKSIVIAVFFLLITLFVLGGLTYAWFSSNGIVSTSRVDATVANADAKLLLSSAGGSSFKGGETANIVQVNSAELEALQPVSTDDLENFCYKVGDGASSTFALDNDAKKYYYGHVYVKAECENIGSYSHMDLYLNDINKMISPDSGSLVDNAARLGLKINKKAAILRMSSDENPKSDQVRNTYINGKLQSDDIVIHTDSKSSFSAVDDPAKDLKYYSASASNAKPFASIELNKIYELEIYLYLEGCDPDCSDAVQKDGADVYVSLMGVLVE